MDGERELVELVLRAARPLCVEVGLLALLEAVDDLAVARGGGERPATGIHLGVLAVQVERRLGALALRALEERLYGEQVRDGDAAGGHRTAAGGTRGAHGVGRL